MILHEKDLASFYTKSQSKVDQRRMNSFQRDPTGRLEALGTGLVSKHNYRDLS
jgi:hypothetical protein